MSAGDQYRARALECIEAAAAVVASERKLALLELAQRWLNLAAQIEEISLKGDALLDDPKPASY